MSQGIHTPGPISVMGCTLYVSLPNGLTETVAKVKGHKFGEQDDAAVTARLLAAAYNAFDSAANKLGVNAVELAQGMQNGGVAELVEALERTSFLLNRIHEGDHNAVRNAAQASRAANRVLAKMKRGAP